MAARKSRAKATDDASGVRRVPVSQPARLVEFGPSWGGWANDVVTLAVAGTFVKLTPPDGVSDEQIGAALDSIRAAGAVSVKLMPRDAGVAPVVLSTGAPAQPRLRHREVVDSMMSDVVGVDLERLKMVVGEIMDEEGL